MPESYRNNHLFSTYYLKNYLIRTPEWRKEDHIEAFDEIKKIYSGEAKLLETYNEGQLREHFFNDIFKALDITYEVEEVTETKRYPDYSFFIDKNSRDEAHKNKGQLSFYTNSIGIGEVKQWTINLDKNGKDEDNSDKNPSLQIWLYLHDTQRKWGILSNGELWRIYCKDKPRDYYYEVNLPSLIKLNDVEAFKFFYYFFRKNAFIPSKDGAAFLDRVLKGSIDYATEIGGGLKENVYLAMKKIAEGFIERPSNHLDRNDPATLARVQKNTMILLYRFLFLLYAEGKGLLDLTDERYYNLYSFHHITREITEQEYDQIKTTLQSEMKTLFDLINQGSDAFPILKEGGQETRIPAYNGGLFDPKKHPDLERWEIGNRYLADAIDLLSRSKLNDGHRDFIDYSTLEIRHLGSIYEGLLEFKLKVAESDLVVSNGEWVTLEQYNSDRKQKRVFFDFEDNDRVKTGQIYLATDNGERRATGSYYTPDYIVDYIVKNTIEPVIEEKWKNAQEKNESLIDATLSVKVLDPAMGSGHFLVGAVETLSLKLMVAAQKDFEARRIVNTALYTNDGARREVVSHCIYGVDLNELAVELAKVGLWLTSISKDKPLSFLDHRLKHGNSLIGAKISDLVWYHEGERSPESKNGQKPFVPPVFVEKISNIISLIEQTGEENLGDIKKKERLFNELQSIAEYQKVIQIADLNTSFYFGNKIENPTNKLPSSYYYNLVGSMYDANAQWGPRSNYTWFKKAIDMGKAKSFFHWELEFPEIFFEAGKIRENPGWDVVIGNPPYVRQETLEPEFKNYLKQFFEGYSGVADLYVYFIEKSHKLLRQSGYFGVICSNKFMKANYGKNIRDLIKNKMTILAIIDFGELPVFKEASTFPAVIITKNELTKEQNFTFTAIKDLHFSSLNDIISRNGIPQTNKTLNGNNWIFGNQGLHSLLNKLKINAIPLSKYVDNHFYWGLKTGYNRAFVINQDLKDRLVSEDSKNEEIIKPYLIGDNIRRYQIHFDETYVIFTRHGINIDQYPTIKKYLEQFRESLEPRPKDWQNGEWKGRKPGKYQWYEIQDSVEFYTEFSKPKIVYPEIAMESRFSYDTMGLFINNKGFFIPTSDLYLLSILNSKTIWFVLKGICSVLGDQDQGGRLELRSVFLKDLPIRSISFTTPPDRLSSLVSEAEGMYQTFIKNANTQPLLAFIDTRLAAQPEESDVAHNLLTFLAERMLELNEEKNVEIKAFLNFVEDEIGVSVDTLSNKTRIQEYYANDFAGFIDLLVKNKGKIKKGYNPKLRAHHDILKDWFDSSVSKLKPIMESITATDTLIDQIVYKLYGLTKEEIEIIESS
jgi:hypothetical protein